MVTRAVDIDETVEEGEHPETAVVRLAEDKGRAAAHSHRDDDLPTLGIAADTLVWTEDGTTLGKPADPPRAHAMMRRLSARAHHVSTGFALFDVPTAEVLRSDVVTTRVRFRDLDEREIEAYVATGEPFDKAGGYGIQGFGAALVRDISGSYSNVVGLPLAEVVEACRHVGRLDGMPWEHGDA